MKPLMNIILVILVCLCIFQPIAMAQSAAQPAAAAASTAGALFPDVVARVNGQPIAGRDLEALVRRELATMGNPEWKDLREDYRSQLIQSALTSLINTRLIYEKAVVAGVTATDAEIDAGVQNVAKNFATDAAMNAALAQQFLNRDTLRQKLAQDLTVSKYLTSLAQAVKISPEEVSKYYAENPAAFAHPEIIRASHILLRGEEAPNLDAQVKARAEALATRARNGEDFAKLARENSVDSTASNGGDIGYVAKSVLDPDFAAAAFAMKVGEIRVVKSRFGYHVIKLTDKKLEGVSSLDEIGDELTTLLKQQKAQVELNQMVNQLRELAKIEVLIPYNI